MNPNKNVGKMPYRYVPTDDEIKAFFLRTDRQSREEKKVEKLLTENNALSVELDWTRDLIFRIMEDLVKEEVGLGNIDLYTDTDKVLEKQVKHREDVLNRLIKTLSKNPTEKNKQLLRIVLSVDPLKPLEPQLGFDPNKF